MRRDHLQPFRDREAGCIGRHQERRNALGARRLAGACEHGIEIGDAAVRDPGLFAVQHIAVAVARARPDRMLATSEPDFGSLSAKAEIAFPARVFGNHARFCAAVPNSEIAPVPRPCIANAKSASPS